MTGKPNVTVLPSAEESDSLFVSLRAPQALAEGLLRLLQVFFGLFLFWAFDIFIAHLDQILFPPIFFNPSARPGKTKEVESY
jgi:hypothetical protein